MGNHRSEAAAVFDANNRAKKKPKSTSHIDDQNTELANAAGPEKGAKDLHKKKSSKRKRDGVERESKLEAEAGAEAVTPAAEDEEPPKKNKKSHRQEGGETASGKKMLKDKNTKWKQAAVEQHRASDSESKEDVSKAEEEVERKKREKEKSKRKEKKKRKAGQKTVDSNALQPESEAESFKPEKKKVKKEKKGVKGKQEKKENDEKDKKYETTAGVEDDATQMPTNTSSKKIPAPAVSADDIKERWNVQGLGGGAKRQDKFMRLLGGKKSRAVAAGAGTSGAESSRPRLDLNKASEELEQQFNVGVRMKFDVSGKRKGLGA